MEFVITTGGNSVLLDSTAPCSISASTCSGSFTVPVGSGYTASLFLYDNCDYLLSAGTASNVSVVAGVNPTLNITLNGVVAYLDITTTATTPFLGDPSAAQPSFTVNVTPLDAGYFNYPYTQ